MDVFDQKIEEIRNTAASFITLVLTDSKLEGIAEILRQQYLEGEGGAGRITPPKDYYPYGKDYMKRKAKRGLPTDRVNLYFDGDLHESLTVSMGTGELNIEFEGYDEEITEWLEGFYGPDVFSPNADSLEKIRMLLLT